MLNIASKNKFGKVIADSIAKVELTVKDAQTKKRWVNAISKAAAQIDNHGEFMTYDRADNQPCWHRTAARLVRLYLELPENTNPQLPAAKKETKEIPYLKNTKEPIRVEKYGSVVLPVYA
jgi:hypothetical protein